MKLLVINGSPRKDGNTSRLINLVIDAAKKVDGDTEVRRYNLNDLTFKGCQGCMGCKQETATGCVQKDDLTPVLHDMLDCEAWVMGTPIYMGHMSGQLKLCVDRVYGFTGPNRVNRVPAGKRAVIAVTQGNQDASQYKAVPDLLSFMLGRRGVEAKAVVACGTGSALNPQGFSQEVQDKATGLGKWLAETR